MANPRRAFAALVALILLGAFPGAALAQEQAEDGVVSGVINTIRVNQDGELLSFLLSDSSGQLVEIDVDAQTQFGLENVADDRWVATLAEAGSEAPDRLRRHRERFAPVTVTVNDGVATQVVDREQSSLEQNLWFLFAIYIVTWAGFFAYVFIMSRRQRDLSREIESLKAQISAAEPGATR
ncbi:MAG: CcmD family protein [Chloroflexota bacterium]